MKKAIKIFGIGAVALLVVLALSPGATIQADEDGDEWILVGTYFEFDIPEVDGHANVSILVYGPPDEVYTVLDEAIIQSQEAIRAAVIPGYGDGAPNGGNGSNNSNVTVTVCAEVSVGYGSTYIKVSVCVTGPPDEVFDMLQDAIERAIEAAKKAIDAAKEKLEPARPRRGRIPVGSMPAPWWFEI